MKKRKIYSKDIFDMEKLEKEKSQRGDIKEKISNLEEKIKKINPTIKLETLLSSGTFLSIIMYLYSKGIEEKIFKNSREIGEFFNNLSFAFLNSINNELKKKEKNIENINILVNNFLLLNHFIPILIEKDFFIIKDLEKKLNVNEIKIKKNLENIYNKGYLENVVEIISPKLNTIYSFQSIINSINKNNKNIDNKEILNINNEYMSKIIPILIKIGNITDNIQNKIENNQNIKQNMKALEKLRKTLEQPKLEELKPVAISGPSLSI